MSLQLPSLDGSDKDKECGEGLCGKQETFFKSL